MVQSGKAVRYSDSTGIRAYCKIYPPPFNHITCYLKYDASDPGEWEKRVFVTDEFINGNNDGRIYRCKLGYDATEDTEELTRPNSGPNCAEHWVVVKVIEVFCAINGGDGLDTAWPPLSPMEKAIDYNKTESPPTRWLRGHPYASGDVVFGTNPREYYRCFNPHTSTVDDRPSSGEYFEDYWEVVYRCADELPVTPYDDCPDIGTWSIRKMNEGELLTGDDDKIYRSKADYDPVDNTTKPGVAGQEEVWGVHWSLIDRIYKTDKVFTAGIAGAAYAP